MPLEAIEPRRLYRQVADQLRQLMDSGEYPVGSRLPTERELADTLGISRPTVREALIALEVEGRVKIRVGSGIYVAEPELKQTLSASASPIEGPFELLRARAFIECAIVEEAARRATPADVAAIDRVMASMQDCSRPQEAMVALDREFHTTIAGILGNAVLERFVGELFDQRVNPFFEQLARYFENSDSWRIAVGEHQAVRDAIAGRDSVAAREAMHVHLQAAQDRLSRSFGEPVRPASGASGSGMTTVSRKGSRRKRPENV